MKKKNGGANSCIRTGERRDRINRVKSEVCDVSKT